MNNNLVMNYNVSKPKKRGKRGNKVGFDESMQRFKDETNVSSFEIADGLVGTEIYYPRLYDMVFSRFTIRLSAGSDWDANLIKKIFMEDDYIIAFKPIIKNVLGRIVELPIPIVSSCNVLKKCERTGKPLRVKVNNPVIDGGRLVKVVYNISDGDCVVAPTRRSGRNNTLTIIREYAFQLNQLNIVQQRNLDRMKTPTLFRHRGKINFSKLFKDNVRNNANYLGISEDLMPDNSSLINVPYQYNVNSILDDKVKVINNFCYVFGIPNISTDRTTYEVREVQLETAGDYEYNRNMDLRLINEFLQCVNEIFNVYWEVV